MRRIEARLLLPRRALFDEDKFPSDDASYSFRTFLLPVAIFFGQHSPF